MSDNHEIEIPVSETERKKAELLRQAKGAEDFSELASMMIQERTQNIHPAALEREEIDIKAVVTGEYEVPDEYTVGNYDPRGNGGERR